MSKLIISNLSTELLYEERKRLEKEKANYAKSIETWASILGRLGLKAAMKKCDKYILEIDNELSKR